MGPSRWHSIANDYSRSAEDRARARELVAGLRRPVLREPVETPTSMDGGGGYAMGSKQMTAAEMDNLNAIVREETANRRMYGGMPFRGVIRQAATRE
jgi:hypothetical protein